MKYQKLYDTTIENGGATWDPRKDKYLRADDGGFIVGEAVGTFYKVPAAFEGPASQAVFDEAVTTLIERFPEAMVGTWRDDEKAIHVDPVRRFGSKEVAIGFGIALKQLAIYDVELGRVIGIR